MWCVGSDSHHLQQSDRLGHNKAHLQQNWKLNLLRNRFGLPLPASCPKIYHLKILHRDHGFRDIARRPSPRHVFKGDRLRRMAMISKMAAKWQPPRQRGGFFWSACNPSTPLLHLCKFKFERKRSGEHPKSKRCVISSGFFLQAFFLLGVATFN